MSLPDAQAAPSLQLPLRPEDESRVRTALGEADPSVLLMVLVQLTGQARWLDEFATAVRPGATPEPAIVQRLHERLVQALRGTHGEPPALSPALFNRMMSACVGQEVPPEYVPMIMEDLGFEVSPSLAAVGDLAERLGDFRVLIIGVGAAGLCAAMQLSRAGIPFEIVEKNPDVGGTWFENRYPGAGVDAPNHLYSFSFEQNHSWSRFFVRQPELLAYFRDCARRYGLYEKIRFNAEVVSAIYSAHDAMWDVTVREQDGQLRQRRVNAVISAVGQLNRPAMPEIPGLDRFRGTVVHTATWHDGVQVDGRRVAMIGTGASGMQAAPTIAPQAARLTIFQRSPNWIRTRPRYHEEVGPGKQWALSALPYYAVWYRFQLFWANSDALHPALQKAPGWRDTRSISPLNAELREAWEVYMRESAGSDIELGKVLPDYPPFGKRPLLDNNWFEMLRRPNVELVTDGIERIEADAVVTRAGERHPADLIVFATGFQASRMLYPMDIRGRQGKTLRELWGDENPRAYLGMTVPGFPNFFLLYGPNTNLGHGGSVIFHLEIQVRYIIGCLELLARTKSRAIECREDVHDAYNERVDAAHEAMVWTHAGVNNWYKNRAGRVTTNSPWRIVDYWTMSRAPREADFVLDGRHVAGGRRMTDMAQPLEAIIVGAGFSGICLGVRLVKAGIRSFAILEKNSGVGGCWHDNDYPGAACDVPSLLYSYSFAPKHDWSRVFSPREEIRRYVEDCADRFGVRGHVRLNTEVSAATYEAERSLWRVETAHETLYARVFVSAVGQLSRPKTPAIPGLDGFRGHAFHSARFDRRAPIDGAHVALIGSGASAIQIAPAIASRVKSLTIFQRSPTWIVPKADRAFEAHEKKRFARFPLIARYLRYRTYWTFEKTYSRIQLGTPQAAAFRAQCNAFIDASVADPALREKLRPDHAPSCKRVLKSNDWYPTLQRRNVRLVTQGIERITDGAVVTHDGVSHPAHTIVFATGFESTRFLQPMAITGLGGERLDRRWADGASAYWGIAAPGFPNFFMMYGPNTNVHNSIIFVIEAQARYIAAMVGHIHAGRFVEADLKPQVMARFDRETQQRAKRFVWADDCNSWYKTAAGRITNNLPYSTLTYLRRTWRPDLGDFDIRQAASARRELSA